MLLRFVITTLVTLCVAGALRSQDTISSPGQDEPSLGDLARQRREKNGTSAGPKRVLSNDDMPSAAPPARVVAGTVNIGGYRIAENHQFDNFSIYTGPCPVRLDFEWVVIGQAPTTVTYIFQRSDGGHSASSLTGEISPSDRRLVIDEDWTLGANSAQYANFDGWVQLDIQAPNQVSLQAPFTIHCTSSAGEAGPGEGANRQTVVITGTSFRANHQPAPDHQYTGPCPVDLEFVWNLAASAPATVTYDFARNDNPFPYRIPQTLQFTTNQIHPLHEYWILGGKGPQFENYAGWVELNVSPNMLSHRIPFTLHCTAQGERPNPPAARSAPASQPLGEAVLLSK